MSKIAGLNYVVYVATQVHPCDNKDTFHQRVISLTLTIARGHEVPLAPMFLGLLYCRLDEIHHLKEQVIGRGSIQSFLCSSFLHIFLCEHFKSLKMNPYLVVVLERDFSLALHFISRKALICRLFRKIQGKKGKFSLSCLMT